MDRPRTAHLLIVATPVELAAWGRLRAAVARVDAKHAVVDPTSGIQALAAAGLGAALVDAGALAERIRQLGEAAPDVAVVAILPSDDTRAGAAALERGADAWLPRDTRAAALVRCIVDHAVAHRRLGARRVRPERDPAADRDVLVHVLAHDPDAILVVGDGDRILFANPAAEALLERPAAELVGTPTALPLDAPLTPEVEIARPGGAVAIADVRVLPLAWAGTPARLVAVRDRTESKQTERKLIQLAEDIYYQTYDVQRFHHAVSHELRTPLTVAREFVGLVLSRSAENLEDTARQHLQLAREACDQMAVCIGDLLDTTRIETGKLRVHPAPASIGDLVHRVVKSITPAATKGGVHVTVDVAPDLPSALIDEVRISQVLMNLLTNALKFTPEGGAILVRAARHPGTSDFLAVSVRDSGCGIDPKDRPHIFERHYEGKDPVGAPGRGLGLGLHICKELVHIHSGTIWLESELGKGTTFTFTVPVCSNAARAAAPAAGAPASVAARL